MNSQQILSELSKNIGATNDPDYGDFKRKANAFLKTSYEVLSESHDVSEDFQKIKHSLLYADPLREIEEVRFEVLQNIKKMKAELK